MIDSLLRRRDALLQLAHLAEQRRLVADRRRHAAEQRRHFRPGLREAEDVVDEEQHVLAFRVAEVLGDGQRREADAQARARRLRHLAVDQRRARLRWVVRVDDAALLELEPEVVALARAFADAAEHRHTAVLQGDVVDQLHDDDGLADAGAAEQADLAALQVRLEQVDDLDAGLEHLQVGRLLFERRRGAVNRPALLRLHRPIREVDRLAEHVQHAAERLGSDRHRDRLAEVDRLHAALHAVGRLHRDGAHAVLAEVLLDLGDDVDAPRAASLASGLDAQRVVDRGQVPGLGTRRPRRAR